MKPAAITTPKSRQWGPPTTTIGTLAAGLGVLASGRLLGALIGRQTALGRNYGGYQGGIIGALGTAGAAIVISVADPDWAPAMGIAALGGVLPMLAAAVISATVSAKSMAAVERTIPGITSAIDDILDRGASTSQLVTPSSSLPLAQQSEPTIYKVLEVDTGKTLNMKVKDQVKIEVAYSSGFEWGYDTGTSPDVLMFNGREAVTTSEALTSNTTLVDTWTALAAGITTLTLLKQAIDANGKTTASTSETVTYTIVVT